MEQRIKKKINEYYKHFQESEFGNDKISNNFPDKFIKFLENIERRQERNSKIIIKSMIKAFDIDLGKNNNEEKAMTFKVLVDFFLFSIGKVGKDIEWLDNQLQYRKHYKKKEAK